MTTAIVYDPVYLGHDTGAHPENADRLISILDAIDEAKLRDSLRWLHPAAAAEVEIASVHSHRLIAQIRRMAELGGAPIDGDTYVSPGSYHAALSAAGGTMLATEAVLNGDVNNAIALVRPPGHHATPIRAMGFCLFNNIAIATRMVMARHKLDRVLIVDFDVHHGNGTQETFYYQNDVLYCSLHRYPFYPGTGTVEEIGEGEGRGFTVNVPLPMSLGDRGHLRVFEEVFVPVARRYKPQLIAVSAGYDGHWLDPLGGMSLSVTGYARMVERLKMLADELCEGKLVFTLEGGYSLKALAHSVVATLQVAMGLPFNDELGPNLAARGEPNIDALLQKVKAVHQLN